MAVVVAVGCVSLIMNHVGLASIAIWWCSLGASLSIVKQIYKQIHHFHHHHQEVALERLVANLVEEKGGESDMDCDLDLDLGQTQTQTCVMVDRGGEGVRHPERLV